MWSLSILKTPVFTRFRESVKQLRLVAALFAFLILVDLFVYSFLIVPSHARMRAAEERIHELKKRQAETVQFKKQKPLFAGLLEGIPAQKDMPLLVKEVVTLARKQNLSIAAVKYDIPRKESGELALLTFSFPAEGRYSDVKRFIYEVETSDRLIGIQDLKLDADQGRVKMQMKLLTYVRGK